MSDWNATYDGPRAAMAGLDFEMPHAKIMTPAALRSALANGTLSEDDLDGKVKRILRLAMRVGR